MEGSFVYNAIIHKTTYNSCGECKFHSNEDELDDFGEK